MIFTPEDPDYEIDLTHITDTGLEPPATPDVPVVLARPADPDPDAMPTRYGRT